MAAIFYWFKLKRAKDNEAIELETITVKKGRKSIIVKIDCINWISSYGPYVLLHTINNEKYVVSDSLKNIITTLPQNFKRIHRSTIVNTKMVKELKSRMNGDYDVIMNDSNILRLSRNYSKSLKGILL